MITRLLESNGVIQHRVDSLTLQKKEGNSLIFNTSINIRKLTLNDSFNGFEDLTEVFKDFRKFKESPGTLRIDAITDTIIRIRYKEAEKVNNNENPMVIGKFEGPSKLKIKKGSKQFLITTGQIIFSINFQENGS